MPSLVELTEGSVYAGEFRVVRPLGEGGMGAVYLVEQLSTGKRRALKVMHPELVFDDKLRARFIEEARVGARIHSDHVVEVVDAGFDTSGAPWLAMELLDGETLEARVDRMGRLAPAEVLDIFAQLAHAVGAAHDAGVVHCDLKPENVFLAIPRREAAETFVKVLDFGIAKLATEAALWPGGLGSPRWMAPEQAVPGARITPTADVWALGLLTFWMLTGYVYWTEVYSPSAKTADLQREALHSVVVPASTRAASYGCESLLPAGFDAWFARCVDRSPGGRFSDARAARAALEPLLAENAVEGTPRSIGTARRSSRPASSGSGGPPRLDPREIDLGTGSASGSLPQVLAVPLSARRPVDATPPPAIEIVSTPRASGSPKPPPSIELELPPPSRRASSSGSRSSQPPPSGARAVRDAPSESPPPSARRGVAPLELVGSTSRPALGRTPSTAPPGAVRGAEARLARAGVHRAGDSSTHRAIEVGPARAGRSSGRLVAMLVVGGAAIAAAVVASRSGFWAARPEAVADGPRGAVPAAAASGGLAVLDCPPQMARVDGAVVRIGEEAHTIEPFCIDTREVSVGAFGRCVRAGRCTSAHTSGNVMGAGPGTSRVNQACNAARRGRDDHPVNCVDWSQANAYCAAQGKSLPTEEQWEFVTRRGAERATYPWGNAAPSDQLCWSHTEPRDGTCPVGSFPRGETAAAVRDLAGNVREWTASLPERPRYAVCGSDWTEQGMIFLAGYCLETPPTQRSAVIGFRCIKPIASSSREGSKPVGGVGPSSDPGATRRTGGQGTTSSAVVGGTPPSRRAPPSSGVSSAADSGGSDRR